MENIKWIFFDIGYTLFNEDKCWDFRCKAQSETEKGKKLGLTPEILYEEISNAARNLENQFRAVINKYNLTEMMPHRTDLEELYDDTISTLEYLSKNYKLGIIANQTEGLTERLRERGLLKYLDVVISSFDYKMSKPNPKIFETAFEKANCNPKESVMVGDRIDNDIIPAKTFGMKTVWIKQGFGALYNPTKQEETPDYTIEHLSQLTKIF